MYAIAIKYGNETKEGMLCRAQPYAYYWKVEEKRNPFIKFKIQSKLYEKKIKEFLDFQN